MQVLQLVDLRDLRHLLAHDGDQVVVVDEFLLVGQLLELVVDALFLVVLHGEAHPRQPRKQRVAAGVLAQHQLGPGDADVFRRHDLVGRALLHDAVLVNAGFVGEGVRADDGLVPLDDHAGHLADQTAGAVQLARVHAGPAVVVLVATHLQSHDELFQRAVARALTQPVDRALDAARAVAHGRQRVGHGQAQVVVAMDMDDRLADVRHVLHQVRDQPAELDRHGVAHRVGNVHRLRAGIDHGLADLRQEIRLRAGGVLRAELHVVTVLQRVLDAPDGLLDDFVFGLLQLELPVDGGGRQEDVDPAALSGRFDRLSRALDVLGQAAGQARNPRVLDRGRDRAHRLEVARRCNGEARLDDVHVQARNLPGHLHLLFHPHARAGTLLPVAQRRVKNDHPVLLVMLRCHVSPLICSKCMLFAVLTNKKPTAVCGGVSKPERTERVNTSRPPPRGCCH